MSGYRQSNYDPEAYEQPGRPLKPFNWVQWTGVGLEVVGIGIFLVHIAGRIGWVRPVFDTGFIGMGLALVGAALINSRRERSSLVSPQQRAQNKRVLLITVAICAVILGAAFSST